jgi:hypothetical protein
MLRLLRSEAHSDLHGRAGTVTVGAGMGRGGASESQPARLDSEPNPAPNHSPGRRRHIRTFESPSQPALPEPKPEPGPTFQVPSHHLGRLNRRCKFEFPGPGVARAVSSCSPEWPRFAMTGRRGIETLPSR